MASTKGFLKANREYIRAKRAPSRLAAIGSTYKDLPTKLLEVCDITMAASLRLFFFKCQIALETGHCRADEEPRIPFHEALQHAAKGGLGDTIRRQQVIDVAYLGHLFWS